MARLSWVRRSILLHSNIVESYTMFCRLLEPYRSLYCDTSDRYSSPSTGLLSAPNQRYAITKYTSDRPAATKYPDG